MTACAPAAPSVPAPVRITAVSCSPKMRAALASRRSTDGVGLFVATGKLDYIPGPALVELAAAIGVLTLAAFLGNVTGYEIGRGLGHRVRNHDGKIVKKKYLDKTDDFFDHQPTPTSALHDSVSTWPR